MLNKYWSPITTTSTFEINWNLSAAPQRETSTSKWHWSVVKSRVWYQNFRETRFVLHIYVYRTGGAFFFKSQPPDFAPTCCPLGRNLVRCGILLTSYGVSRELHNHVKHKCLKNLRLAFQGRPWIPNSLRRLDIRKITKTELPGTCTVNRFRN